MERHDAAPSRIIQISNGIIGPKGPSAISIIRKKPKDYPKTLGPYLEIAKNYSSAALAGPPICDELMALLQHMYTEEEATIVRHLKPMRMKSPKGIARAEHREEAEVRNILDHITDEKGILWRFGKGRRSRYSILPLIPGTFEFALMGTPKENITDWQRMFARRFEDLYNVGYGAYYAEKAPPIIRSIPVGRSIDAHPVALPSSKWEEIFDRYDSFGVGMCSCRTASGINGEGCEKPLEVCTGIGMTADMLIRKGILRRVEKKEIFEIKKQAEESGLVNWMFNVDERFGNFGNFSCSCCGCCCAIFRMITDFNMPGIVAHPYFMPAFDDELCVSCGECAKRCPLGAITVNTKGKTLSHDPKRCVGCGQCVLACEKKHAIEMRPTGNYKKPPSSWPMAGISMLPEVAKLGWGMLRKSV